MRKKKPDYKKRRASMAKLAVLRAALIEGEASGTPEPFDFDAFITRKCGIAKAEAAVDGERGMPFY